MDFARSRPDTGVGGSGGAVLASVPARRGRPAAGATGTNRDSRHGTGNGGNGVCRGFQGWSLLGGGGGAGGAAAQWRTTVTPRGQPTRAHRPRTAQRQPMI